LICMVVLVLFISGCCCCPPSGNDNSVSSNSAGVSSTKPSPTSPKQSPSEVADIYFSELMGSGIFGRDYEKMYQLLSKSVQEDYDKFADEQKGVRTAFTMQGVTFEYIDVVSEEVNGDKATVTIKCKVNMQGYPTTGKPKIDLVLENGHWKLTQAYTLAICGPS